MNFNNFRSGMPISNNKLVGFGEKNSQNPQAGNQQNYQSNNQNYNYQTPMQNHKEEKPVEINTTKNSSASYRAYIARHERLSKEIDRKNKKD